MKATPKLECCSPEDTSASAESRRGRRSMLQTWISLCVKIIRSQIKTKAITQYLGDIRDLVSWGGRSVRHGLYDVVDDVYGGIAIQNHKLAHRDDHGVDVDDLVTVGIGFVDFTEVLAKLEEYRVEYPDNSPTFMNTASTFDPWDMKINDIAWGVAFAADRVVTTVKVLSAWRKKHKYRRTRPGFVYDESEGGPIPREQGDTREWLAEFRSRSETEHTTQADRWRRHDDARTAGLWPVMEETSPNGEARRETFERWLRGGQAIGVYENMDLGSRNVGGLSFAPVDPASPRQRLDDWRYSLQAVETLLDRFVFV